MELCWRHVLGKFGCFMTTRMKIVLSSNGIGVRETSKTIHVCSIIVKLVTLPWIQSVESLAVMRPLYSSYAD